MTTGSDPLDLEANEAAAAERADEEAAQQIVSDDDFLWWIGDKRGRRALYQLLSETGVFRNPYVSGSGDLTAFRCGEMNVGQRYLAKLQRLSPETFHIMTKEHEHGRHRKHQRSSGGK